ncbi:MAG: right-handed parallel beta-helix repeat-containing protein [Proteobacteria bacterium]|nr:right-handed parallel beta-helix repeat-containing protein [Pseudomonadota bacterium]
MKKISLIATLLILIFGNLRAEDILLTGVIDVSEQMVYKNKKITIAPSTRIRVNNSLESGLVFENCSIIFDGASSDPVIVEGYGNLSELEDKNLIHIEDSDFVIKNSIFKNGSWYLHIHHSKGTIENSFFSDGYGGIRFTGENIKIRRNIFSKNSIAVRFIKAEPFLEDNIFYKNDIAIFLREGVKSTVIRGNSFLDNNFDLYGGFFQEDDIKIYNNFFQKTPSVFDSLKDNSLKFKIILIDNLKNFPDWH